MSKSIIKDLYKKRITFSLDPSGKKKYIALIPVKGKIMRVPFGAVGYQQYKDQIPKNIGGKQWSRYDHLDPDRRKAYRKRHSSILLKDGTPAFKKKYSPAWFSYHLLW